MCCRQQRPREAKNFVYFYGFRWRQHYQFLALRFLVNNFFEKKLMKTKIAIGAES